VKSLTSAIQSLPATAGQHWEDVIPVEIRQAGGPVRAGMPYIVGDRGPELFVPGSRGYVYNNTQTQNVLNDTRNYTVQDGRAMAFLEMTERIKAKDQFAHAAGMW